MALSQTFIGGVRNNSQFFLEQQETFFYSCFIPYLEENQINTIWILGDFFENRKTLSIVTLNRATKFLETLQSKNINVVMLLGNHDTVYRNTNEINSLSPISKSFSNVRLIDKFETINFDGLDVGFISWISQDIRDECLQWIKLNDASVLCGHFEINSFEIIRGVICSSGFSPELFERYEKVFSGHFHIRANNGIIHYIGNPYQTNWGEYGFEKGFAVFDTADKSVRFVNNPIKTYEVIYYTDEIDLTEFNFDFYSNKIVRVFSDSTKQQNRRKLELFIEKLSNYTYSLELIEDKEVIIDENSSYQTTDTLQLINQFLDSCTIEHLDKNQLQQFIFEIYKEAVEKGINEC